MVPMYFDACLQITVNKTNVMLCIMKLVLKVNQVNHKKAVL